MALIHFLFSLYLGSQPLNAADYGFRFSAGYCNKDRKPGLNPEYYGECGNVARGHLIRRRDTNMNLKGANLNASYTYYSRFAGGNLSHMALREAILLQSEFINLKAQYLDLRGSHLKAVHFRDVDLNHLLAPGTRFTKTTFENCNLSEANFWGANLQETSFKGSDLSGADLINTFLLFTDFEGAKFNSDTKLPFSEESAIKRGMIKIDPISEESS